MNLRDIEQLPTTTIALCRMDGRGGIATKKCKRCGAHLVAVFASSGARIDATDIPPLSMHCMNTKGSMGGLLPCPEAAKAKPLLDAIQRMGTS